MAEFSQELNIEGRRLVQAGIHRYLYKGPDVYQKTFERLMKLREQIHYIPSNPDTRTFETPRPTIVPAAALPKTEAAASASCPPADMQADGLKGETVAAPGQLPADGQSQAR